MKEIPNVVTQYNAIKHGIQDVFNSPSTNAQNLFIGDVRSRILLWNDVYHIYTIQHKNICIHHRDIENIPILLKMIPFSSTVMIGTPYHVYIQINNSHRKLCGKCIFNKNTLDKVRKTGDYYDVKYVRYVFKERSTNSLNSTMKYSIKMRWVK